MWELSSLKWKIWIPRTLCFIWCLWLLHSASTMCNTSTRKRTDQCSENCSSWLPWHSLLSRICKICHYDGFWRNNGSILRFKSGGNNYSLLFYYWIRIILCNSLFLKHVRWDGCMVLPCISSSRFNNWLHILFLQKKWSSGSYKVIGLGNK